MRRVETNKQLLNNIVNSCVVKNNFFIDIATEDELKTIIECIINVKLIINVNNSEKCSAEKLLYLTRYFSSKTLLNVNRVKTVLKKHIIPLRILLACALARQQEDPLYKLYNDDGDHSSHDSEGTI